MASSKAATMFGLLAIAGKSYSTAFHIFSLSLQSSELEFSVNEKNELLAGVFQAVHVVRPK